LQVLRSLEPALDADAIQTVQRWKFKPATKDGKPVAFRMNVQVDYTKGDAGTDKVYSISDPGVVRPRPIRTPEPDYSETARQKRIEGTVKLLATVGPDGRTRDIRVSDSLEPSLDENAIQAIKKWTFDPCTKDGKPVACRMKVEVEYRLGR